VVLFGKTDHPEVIGLSGQAEGIVKVVQNDSDVMDIELEPPVYLFSQTTMSRERFEKVANVLQSRLGNPEHLIVKDTICGQVYGRGPHLKSFAASHEVMIFVSGKHSSNGKYLFGLCKEANPRSFFVSDTSDIQQEWFNGVQTVGISGAASTPVRDLVETARLIEKF
jgi:4-hydroxy-3-methylbut-2-enyl diphosphate reductase